MQEYIIMYLCVYNKMNPPERDGDAIVCAFSYFSILDIQWSVIVIADLSFHPTTLPQG